MKSSIGAALAARTMSFSEFLAPLNQKTFKKEITEVEKQLRVVYQTLSMLSFDNQDFEAILREMLSAITWKIGELLGADRTTIYLLDEEQHQLWSILAKDDGDGSLEIRIPVDRGIAGEAATTKQVINIPFDCYQNRRSNAAKEFDKKTGYRTYTMLTLPLLNEQGDLVAVVQLLNRALAKVVAGVVWGLKKAIATLRASDRAL